MIFSTRYIVRTLDRYRIELKKLAPAASIQIDYVLDNEFFEAVEGQEIRKGKVNVSISIVGASSAFELNFHLQGSIVGVCDRCLEDMEIPIETENRLVVALGEAFTEISDEYIIISEEEGYLNVAWYLYEFIALSIPIQHIHEQGECNELMAAKLRELSVDEYREDEESDIEADAMHPEQTKDYRQTDPRWDALRHLIEDN